MSKNFCFCLKVFIYKVFSPSARLALNTEKERMKKKELNTTAEDTIAVPMSIRLPVKEAYLLHLYSEQMGTSPGKMLTSILEDVLPAFESGEAKVTIRRAQVYSAIKTAKLLNGVNEQSIKDRLLKRTDPGGEIGRPPKSRKIDV